MRCLGKIKGDLIYVKKEVEKNMDSLKNIKI
jgi:hypothetical protein